MRAFIDISGQRFGRLLVISFSHFQQTSGSAYWDCICDCGTKHIIHGGNLRNGTTKSCGCLRREATKLSWTKHGHAPEGNKSPEYRCWRAMINRCENPKANRYECYGGRGIAVYGGWRHSFENFFADMGPKPSSKHSIDRINNDGNYEPGNCRWATGSEQARNKHRYTSCKEIVHE